MYLSGIQSIHILNEDYYDRFTFKKGGASYYGWIRIYSNFIISQTSDNANILIPPRLIEYKMEGNTNYFRWFMYPRRVYHQEDFTDKTNVKIDHIVLSAGECENKKCVWPNYKISKNEINKIILIDRKNQEIETLYDVEYHPENFYQKWGLIKLK